MNFPTIIKTIFKDKYTCDKCNKKGDLTNMIHIIGKGVFHVICLKKK